MIKPSDLSNTGVQPEALEHRQDPPAAPKHQAALPCGCGPEAGLYRYCDRHNPCFQGGAPARADKE